MNISIFTVILIFAFSAPSIFAQEFEIDEFDRLVKKYRCVSDVWIEDKDPKGTNVRDAPSIQGKIIDVFERETEDEPQGSIFMLGYENGWVKIFLGQDVKNNRKFDKFGWISAKLITANAQTKTGKPAFLYSLPKRSSKKVGKIPSENLIRIVGFNCFGYKIEYKGIVGWISHEDVCGNPLTTCS